jgi:hypothetical protein
MPLSHSIGRPTKTYFSMYVVSCGCVEVVLVIEHALRVLRTIFIRHLHRHHALLQLVLIPNSPAFAETRLELHCLQQFVRHGA